MGLTVANNAYGTLNASITNSATTLVLASGQGARFPTLSAGDYFYGTLIDTSNNLEIVKVTARSTDTLTIVRAQDNTTARAYSTNDRFELRPTAALFNDVITTANGALPKSGGVMASGGRIQFQTAEGNTHYGIRAVRYGYSSSYGALQIGDGSSSQQNISLGVDVSAIAGGAFTGNGKDIVVPNGGMISMPNAANTDFTVPLRFNSFGAITLPNQPSFRVSFNASSQTTGVMAWNNVQHNTGSYFNTSTYTFTAPVAGRYLFNVMAASNRTTSTGDFYVDLELNGTRTNRIYTAPSGGGSNVHSQASSSAILNLAANDAVRVTVQATPGTVGILQDQYHNTFSGQLIG